MKLTAKLLSEKEELEKKLQMMEQKVNSFSAKFEQFSQIQEKPQKHLKESFTPLEIYLHLLPEATGHVYVL